MELKDCGVERQVVPNQDCFHGPAFHNEAHTSGALQGVPSRDEQPDNSNMQLSVSYLLVRFRRKVDSIKTCPSAIEPTNTAS